MLTRWLRRDAHEPLVEVVRTAGHGPVQVQFVPAGAFVPHGTAPVLRDPRTLPLAPEGPVITDEQALQRLDQLAHSRLLPALLATEVRRAPVRDLSDADAREAAEEAVVDHVPPAFRQALQGALELFRDPQGRYHPFAVRTLNHRLYHWLVAQGAEGRWTPARVATVRRYLRLLFDADGRPRLAVQHLVRATLPLLRWAEKRWGAALFATTHGDAADWFDYISTPDGEPTERLLPRDAQALTLEIHNLPFQHTQRGAWRTAGPAELCWRARTCTLSPVEWWALMLRCETFVVDLERAGTDWDDLVWSGRPLPQTALLRRMFADTPQHRALFPDRVRQRLPAQWSRPSSRVLTLLAHVLAVLEDCETLRAAVALAESNGARLRRPDQQPLAVLTPALAGHSTAPPDQVSPVPYELQQTASSQLPSDADWNHHFQLSLQLYPFAWEPPFLAYVQSCTLHADSDVFLPQLLAFAERAVFPLILRRPPDPSCLPTPELRARLRADYETCAAWPDARRWASGAPLAALRWPRHPVTGAFLTLEDIRTRWPRQFMMSIGQ